MRPNRFSLFSILCFVLLFCSCNAPISKDKLVEILIEMHLVEQKIQIHPEFGPISDTTLVYAAILKKHGYTPKDFNQSLSYYLQKPDKFRKAFIPYRDRILKQQNILQKEIDDANRKPDTLEWMRRFIPVRPVFPPFSILIDSIIQKNLDSLNSLKMFICEPDTVRTPVFSMFLELPSADSILTPPKIVHLKKEKHPKK